MLDTFRTPMTQCTLKLPFKSIKKRKVIADFTGGNITADAGLLLLREIDRGDGVIVSSPTDR